MTRFTYAAYPGINMKKRIIDKEIVKDISKGMTGPELTKKYNLSQEQLRSIIKQLAKLRESRIRKLVSDLRSGMACSELMKKYQLSTEGLASALNRLLAANAISPDELKTFRSSLDEQRTLESRGRSTGKKTIKAKELLEDIRAGLDDAELMEKYGFSAGGILKALNKLIWQGLMSPSEFTERRSLAKTVYMPVFECRSCGEVQFSKVEKCPSCGARMKTLSGEKADFSD
jgi:Mor family transcriptional regulator